MPEQSLDEKEVLPHLVSHAKNGHFDFAAAAKAFRMIDTDMVDVIVPWGDEGVQAVNHLRIVPAEKVSRRSLQRFTVQIYRSEAAALMSLGALETVHERYLVLNQADLYDPCLGLQPPSGLVLDTSGCFL